MRMRFCLNLRDIFYSLVQVFIPLEWFGYRRQSRVLVLLSVQIHISLSHISKYLNSHGEHIGCSYCTLAIATIFFSLTRAKLGRLLS